MIRFREKLTKFKRQYLKEVYVQLPIEKKQKFDSIYKQYKNLDSVPVELLLEVIELIERTLIKIERENGNSNNSV